MTPPTSVPEPWSPESFLAHERSLLRTLQTHGAREGAALEAYAKLVDECDDEGVVYLGRLLLEDETRHHQMIDEMLNSVRSFVEDLDIEPRAPEMVNRISGDLLAETKRLLAFEKEDLAELRQLRKQLKAGSSWPLFGLLVELMIHDTRKHIAILKFIRASA